MILILAFFKYSCFYRFELFVHNYNYNMYSV